MTTERIDVLAAIRFARETHDSETARESLRKIESAVAELIDAAHDIDGIGGHDGSMPHCAQCKRVARFNAALARVGAP